MRCLSSYCPQSGLKFSSQCGVKRFSTTCNSTSRDSFRQLQSLHSCACTHTRTLTNTFWKLKITSFAAGEKVHQVRTLLPLEEDSDLTLSNQILALVTNASLPLVTPVPEVRIPFYEGIYRNIHIHTQVKPT